MHSFQLSVLLPGSPELIFNAWLDAKHHAAFTGEDARIEPFAEGTFHLAQGYITGRNLIIEPYKRIIQSWRSADFPQESPASRLELRFHKKANDTIMELIHSGYPDGMEEELRQRWRECYLDPMQTYFADLNQGTQIP